LEVLKGLPILKREAETGTGIYFKRVHDAAAFYPTSIAREGNFVKASQKIREPSICVILLIFEALKAFSSKRT
jgi:hypothetical protein